MKYKDYYATLGIERGASEAGIKKAYRALAQKNHPDVSKAPDAESRFKEIAEAYQTLKDPERRAAYDQLGAHPPGQEFKPPPDWGEAFKGGPRGFDDLDLGDLFAGTGERRWRAAAGGVNVPLPGQDYELTTRVSLEDAYTGTLIDLDLSLPELDADGRMRRVARVLKARVPKGATHGQRLRLAGQGGRGFNGGRNGDLYLTIELLPHRLFRVSGHDLYHDQPRAPWEAALGTSVEVPTLGGPVQLKVPAGLPAEQSLRLGGRGLPRPGGGSGDLFAIPKIVLPPKLTDREQELFKSLADVSTFNPRARLQSEPPHEN